MALLGAYTVFRARSGEDWGTAYGVLASGVCCGLPLGAIAGFAAALRMVRDGLEDWSAFQWLGVALGIALGPMACSFGVSNLRLDLTGVLIVAVATAVCGTLGGLLATACEGLWRRASRDRSPFITAVLGLLFTFIPAMLLLIVVALLYRQQLTGLRLAWSILIGAPILWVSAIWLRRDEWQDERASSASGC